MKTVQEIEQAILDLPAQDLAALRQWFAALDADRWDREIEDDVAAGKLDWLIEESKNLSRERERPEFD